MLTFIIIDKYIIVLFNFFQFLIIKIFYFTLFVLVKRFIDIYNISYFLIIYFMTLLTLEILNNWLYDFFSFGILRIIIFFLSIIAL